jgi:hypothetical protein
MSSLLKLLTVTGASFGKRDILISLKFVDITASNMLHIFLIDEHLF